MRIRPGARKYMNGPATTGDKTGEPLVSVVMSVYNEKRYVRAAAESILAQTHKNLELVVVDDGSTDATPEILSQIDDPRLRVIRQENRGQPAGLNAGLLAARGELITFMDGDDLCDPRRIQEQVEFVRAHPELHGAGCWELLIDARGNEVGREETPCQPEVIASEYTHGRNGLNGMSTMAWAEVFRQVGGFREELYMANDVDMWMRATERFKFGCIPKHLYHYRMHANSSNVARRKAIQFYRSLVMELREERFRTGSDRLDRGEHIEVPRFDEQSGVSSYRQSIVLHYGAQSRRLARAGQWGQALKFAVKCWGHEPLGWRASVELFKTFVGVVLPFTRPHLDTVRASLVEAMGLGGVRPRTSSAGRVDGRSSGPACAEELGPSAVGELSSTLIRDFDGFAALAEEWDALLKASDTPTSFFLSSISLLPFWRTYSKGRSLTVVLVRKDDGELVGAAPFYVETVGHRFSRHRRLALLGSPESGADYLDVIARLGFRRAVLRETFECLRRNAVRWGAVNLDSISSDSPTLAIFERGQVGHRFRLHRGPETVCPYTRLPATWDDFVAGLGGSTRRGMKYQLNLLQRKFSDVSFQLCTEEGEIKEMLERLIVYKQARYGHWFDRDYLAWPEQAIVAQRAGCLRFWVVRLDGHPACLWLTFLFEGRVFFQACSYDPEHADLRLGKVMMPHAIRHAIEEGATEYDMKRGDASYKFHWADRSRRILQVNAVRRSLRGTWISFWEYSALIAGVRKGAWTLYRTLRRPVRRRAILEQ
ncbi:MAG: GNAT family N-acetyltransferase [Planctomycetota bacterium]